MKSLIKNRAINISQHLCAIICIAGVLISCNEDFLKPKPLSTFMPENTYTNKTAMVALLNECRYRLKQEFLNTNPLLCSELIVSDISTLADAGSQALKDLDTQLTPTSAGNSKILDNSDSGGETSYWAVCFASIKSANVVISRHEKATYDSEQDKNEILAEGYFHRAYWYYRVVHQYGDVPYIDGEITRPTVDLYTMSRKGILSRIAVDMEFAVKHLPESVKFGEVSRAAGYHLLAKIYLSLGRFDDAIAATTEVIEKSGLALMKNRFGVDAGKTQYNVLWDIFQKENISIAANKEGILIGQDNFATSGTASSSDGSRRIESYGPLWWQIPGMVQSGAQYEYLGRGISRVRPTSHFNYTIWNGCGDDLRHKWPNWFPLDSLKYNQTTNVNYNRYLLDVYKEAVANYQPGVSGTKPPALSDFIGDTLVRWFPFQYYKTYVRDENFTYGVNSSTTLRGGWTDVYIFRLAETYLLRAEAYWWKNDLEKAKNDINEVRGRANASLVTVADVTIDYILDERARELYMEEPRKTELTRITFLMADQGKNGYSTNNIHQKNFYYDRVMRTNDMYRNNYFYGSGPIFRMSPYHYLWPIPQRDINANVEGHINQNLGYAGSETNIKPLE